MKIFNIAILNFIFILILLTQIINTDEPEIQYVKIGDEFQVNTITDDPQTDPDICSIGKHGEKFVVVWQSFNQYGSDTGVYAQIFDSKNGEKIGSEFKVIEDTDLVYQMSPSISSIGKHGEKFVVTWVNLDGSGFGTYAQIFDSTNGEKIGSEFKVNIFNSYKRYPRISSIGKHGDKFVITWQSYEQDGSNDGIYAQVFDSNTGEKIGNEFQVNTYTYYHQIYPSVSSIGKHGDQFVITWQSYGQDGSNYGIYAQVFDSNTGEKIGNEFQVNTYTYNRQEYPSVSSIGKHGDKFIITWQSYEQDGSSNGIYAQVFDSNTGEKIDEEFQVNTYTYSSQSQAYVSSIGKHGDQFVITWQSYGQDGSDFGIYAQVFDSNTGEKIDDEFQVNTYTDSSQICPSVSSIGKHGEKFVITWQSYGQDGSNSGIYAQIFSSKKEEEI
ncbi:enhanced RNAi (RNA interference) [Anaeramoeba flamelloides]|uniref:Enhanced RNAi (RNA interference) n=1 Tax=Anaeramoeba flamelloides TaxID=1746091 RepID=A0ABQ8ZDX7_9EUKA|nr:enhanced RNAi (RNA interference) [Anaeramoeba flamelloides]